MFPYKERAAYTTGTDAALCVTGMILLVQKHACMSYRGDVQARGSHKGNQRSWKGPSADCDRSSKSRACPELDTGHWLTRWGKQRKSCLYGKDWEKVP